MIKWILGLCLFINTLQAKLARSIILDSPSYIGGAGLFHNFNIVLGVLDLYDMQDHLALTIDLGSNGLYYEEAYGSNWWSYYFKTLYYPFKEAHLNKKPLSKTFSDSEKGYIGNKAHFFMDRVRAHGLIEKYIHVKSEILDEVEKFYETFLKGYEILGVHYRSTDKWLEATPVSYQEVIEVIDNVIKSHPEKTYRLFVATDEVTFLEVMKNRYDIYYTNAQRMDKYPIHYVSEQGYLKGKEALIDCLLLAKSDVLVRTNSNLSAVAAYFNPSMAVINLNTVNNQLYEQLRVQGCLNELNIKPK
ncbi:MAG: nodulation protein NodZ [Chlamydiota bacterium]